MSGDKVASKPDRAGVVCQALLIVASLFFTSGTDIYKFILIVAINAVYMFFHNKGFVTVIKISPYVLWLLTFNFVLCLYGLLTTYGGYSFLYQTLIVVACLMIYINIVSHSDDIEGYICDFSTVVLLLMIIYLAIYERSMLISKWRLLIQGTSWYRLGNAIGINSNLLAMYLAIFSFFAIKSILRQNVLLKKIALIILVCLVGVLIFFTGSKKGLILLVLFAVSVPIIGNKKKINIKGLAIGIGCGFVVLYASFKIPIFYNIIGHRFAEMFAQLGIKTSLENTGLVGSSTELRSGMFKKAMEMFMDHPFFGGGWNVFQAKAGFGLYSHNNYAELMVSMGLLGLGLFYSFYIYVTYHLIGSKSSPIKKDNIILLLSLLFIDSASINAYGSILDFFVIGVIYILMMQDKFAEGENYVGIQR